MTACFLGNISVEYYKNPSMLSQAIAKNVGDVFFETQRTCSIIINIPGILPLHIYTVSEKKLLCFTH